MKQRFLSIGLISIIILLSIFSFLWWESRLTTPEKSEVKGIRENTFTSKIILEIFNGPVVVVKNGKAETGMNGIELKQGNVISTSGNGRAQIVFPNGTVTRLDKNTTVTLQKAQISPQQVQIIVNEGQTWSRIAELLQNETYETLSNNLTASVRGTSYGHSLLPGKAGDEIVTTKGEVYTACANKKQESIVGKDKKAVFTCNDEKVQLVDISSDKNNEWYKFNDSEDENLNNRFGPFTYRDDEKNSVLGLFSDVRNSVSNVVNSITGKNNTNSSTNTRNTDSNTRTSTSIATNSNNTNNNNENSNGSPSNNPISTPRPNPTNSPSGPTETPAPKKIVGVIKLADEGSAVIYDPQTQTSKKAENGSVIPANASISVAGAPAVIEYNRDTDEKKYTVTRVDAGTTVTVKSNSQDTFDTTVEVNGVGRIWNRILPLLGNESFESDSGTMVATVRGTHYAHLNSKIDNKEVEQIITVDGNVFGKCKNDPGKNGMISRNRKTSFNCYTDSVADFVESLSNLEDEDANWIVDNVRLDPELSYLLNQNKAPTVVVTSPRAGEEYNFTSAFSSRVELNADIRDDGLPFGEPGIIWICKFIKKPGKDEEFCGLNAIIDNHFKKTTTAQFFTSGEYTFTAFVSDVEFTTPVDVKFTVNITEENKAPVVDAGQDIEVFIPNKAQLNGTVTDDGLPLKKPLFSTWSLVNGPPAFMKIPTRSVRIENAFSLNSRVDFGQSFPPNIPGEYVFRLSSFDGSKFGVDDVSVILKQPLPSSTPTPSPTFTPTPTPTVTVTPTPSPAATLEISDDQKQVTLKVENLFSYTSLSYIFSYDSAQGKQGGSGAADTIVDNKYEKIITLGTCSTDNECNYHSGINNLIADIKLIISSEESKMIQASVLTLPKATPTITTTATVIPSPTVPTIPPTAVPTPKVPVVTTVARESLNCSSPAISKCPVITVNGQNFEAGIKIEARYKICVLGVCASTTRSGTVSEIKNSGSQLKASFTAAPANTSFDIRVYYEDGRSFTFPNAFNTSN